MSTEAKMSFGLIDVTAKQDTTANFTNKQPFIKPQDLALEGVFPPPSATLEKDFWKLDGTFFRFPDLPQNTSWGIWSLIRSGVTGAFATPLTLTLTFQANHSSIGLSFEFNPYGNDFCNNLNIKWYRGTTVISDKNFTPDNWRYSCMNTVENYNKIVITFKAMNKPDRYLKVQNILHGVYKFFEKEEVQAISLLEEVDPTSAELSINTLDFRIYSEDDDFNIFNPTGIYNLLQKKQQITVEGDINGVTANLGMFYVEGWESSENKIMNISAIDGVGIMGGTYFMGGIYADKNTGQLVSEILTDAGLGYELDSSLSNILLSGWIPRCTHREALQQVAMAVGAYVDTSRGGTIKIKPQPTTQTVPYILGRNRKQSGTSVRLKPYVTAVNVTEHSYTLATDTKQLFKGELDVGDNEILFSSPSSPTSISGGTFKEKGVNHCIVTVTAKGQVTVSGRVYEDSTKIATKKMDSLPAGEKENVLEVKNATLVSAKNSKAVAERVFNHYQKRIEQNLSFVLNNENVGGACSVEVGEGVYKTSVIQSLETDLMGGFITKAVVVGE